MAESGHRDLMTEGKACGTCHGPGSLHAASGGLRDLILEPRRLDAAAADAACAACHDAAKSPTMRWTCSEHRAENVACVACHSPNEPLGKTLRQPDPALCISCHRDTGAEFRLPDHHRVLEGAMTCNDCHDPHANESGFHRFELTRETCLRCHPEKGGPFVFDHTAKTLEGCVVCHRPHGSPNARLLETRDVRTSCLACHAGDLPRSHEQKAGSDYRHCLRCHVEIHGSDSSRIFLR
jgi:DmsE family decaheme c-type cytochrome